MFNYRCNCEHGAHGSRGCPSGVDPRTPARADYVGAVCDWCAHEHLSECLLSPGLDSIPAPCQDDLDIAFCYVCNYRHIDVCAPAASIELPPYNPNAVCEKCGSEDIHTQHTPACPTCPAGSCRVEHMAHYCRQCTWSWAEMVPPARCYYAEECEETHPTFILDARVADMSDEKASLQKVCDTCVHLHIAGVKRTHKMVVSVAGYRIFWVSRVATLRHVSLKEPIATFYGADAVANASLFMSVLARIDLQRHEYVHFKK